MMARYCGYHGKEIKPPTPAYWCSSCNWYVCWECQSHRQGHGYCPSCGNRTTRVNQDGGGCFITTATLLATGKNDDCEELKVFRDYRDTWLINQKGGAIQIEEYNSTAPIIVSEINNRTDAPQIYSDLWANEIKPCYDSILKGEFEEARKKYSCAVLKLKEQFLDKNSQLA